MANDERTGEASLLVQDELGRCYAIPAEVLEQYRVPPEREAEARALLIGADDVTGYSLGTPRIPMFVDPAAALAVAAQAVWLSFSFPLGPHVTLDLRRAIDMAPTGPSVAGEPWNSPSPREEAGGPAGPSAV